MSVSRCCSECGWGLWGVQGQSGEALTTLFSLERTIQERMAEGDAEAANGAAPGGKLSWTQKLLADPTLLCSKIRWEQQNKKLPGNDRTPPPPSWDEFMRICEIGTGYGVAPWVMGVRGWEGGQGGGWGVMRHAGGW